MRSWSFAESGLGIYRMTPEPQGMSLFARFFFRVLHLGFGDILLPCADPRFPTHVRMHHDCVRGVAVNSEVPLQDLGHKFPGCVVIIEQDDRIERRRLRFSLVSSETGRSPTVTPFSSSRRENRVTGPIAKFLILVRPPAFAVGADSGHSPGSSNTTGISRCAAFC